MQLQLASAFRRFSEEVLAACNIDNKVKEEPENVPSDGNVSRSTMEQNSEITSSRCDTCIGIESKKKLLKLPNTKKDPFCVVWIAKQLLRIRC